jgi:beta-lactamase regulating signal transducer with metallopeptidase domain
MTAFTWLLALALRSTAVLAAALLLTTLLRRGRAVARHRLLTLAAIGLLLLPALPVLLPRWELPLPRIDDSTTHGEGWRSEKALAAAPIRAESERSLADEGRTPSDGRASAAVAQRGGVAIGTVLAAAIVVVWATGVLTNLAGLGLSLHREQRLLARARPLDGPWRETLAEAQRSLSVSRPVRLLLSEEVETPSTGGWPQPALLLPAAAMSWPEERRRLVVQHELLHVVGGDALRHLAWRLAVALYWCHPLARLAERRARLATEQACDEAVVRLGARPSTYARHLLEIAETLRAQPPTFAGALPMVEPSQLERRLAMILDENLSAGRRRLPAAVCFVLLAGTVVAAGAVAPAAKAVDPAPAKAVAPAAKAVVAASAAAAAAVPAGIGPEAGAPACVDGISGTFEGNLNEGPSGTDLNGIHNGDFTLQHHLGNGRRLCARVHGPVRFDERNGSIRELPSGASVLIETRAGKGRSERMLVTAEEGQPRYQWWRNDVALAVDDAARAWLADALEVVAAYRAIGSIQGEVGSLQGAIGSIQGDIGSLQGQIGSIQGEEGSLQGKVGSIQGEEGSLEGAIGGHQGAIGSLEAERWRADGARLERIDRQIREHEDAIRKLEAERTSGSLSRRLSEAEAELQAFHKTGGDRIAELQHQIEAMKAEDGIGRLERQIEDLHADDRIREIERRMKPALERLKARLQ